ncbi:MAG: AzlC family ABC transporter permease [Kiritimatiellia bacterium]
MLNVLPGFSQIAPRERKAVLRRAFVNSLPVLMGYVTMGFAAGVLFAAEVPGACAPVWSLFLAALVMSGTMSFAIVPAICAGMSCWGVALLTLGINFRYAFYGFSLLKKWRGIPRWQKWFLIHSLADEIYALDVGCRLKDPIRHRYYCLWNHAFNMSYWIVGSVAGAIAGTELPIPSQGIEFAMVALFLVIFTDQMKGFAKHHD